MGDMVLRKESGRTVGLVLVVEEVEGSSASSVVTLDLGAERSTTTGFAMPL